MSNKPSDDWIDRAIAADPVELDFDEFSEPSGPPLSSEEIEVGRSNLIRCQEPELFKIAVDTLCAR